MVALSHWPLEVSVSRAALVVIEELVRVDYLGTEPSSTPIAVELENLANIIRSHLQHAPAPIVKAGPVETLLLEQAGKHCGRAEAELFLKAATMVAGRESAPAVSTDEDWLA